MRTEKSIVKSIRVVVEDFKENKLVELWNEFCDKNCYEERIWYLSDYEINDLFSNKIPAELIRMGSDLDLDNKYFYFHLGELNTTDNIFDLEDPVLEKLLHDDAYFQQQVQETINLLTNSKK